MAQPVSSWTDERVAALRKHWGDGCSAGWIAKRLGGTSRNAVIGKIHRLGLARHPQPLGTKRIPRISNPLGNKAGRLHRGTNGGLASKLMHRVKHPPKLKVMRIEVGPPEALMIPLMQLNDHTCKYGLGEATGAKQLFCGAPKDIEVSWCPYHCRIVFQPDSRKAGADRKLEKLAA